MLRKLALVASLFLLAWNGPAAAQSVEELKARLQQLEQENASLRRENNFLRDRVVALEGGNAKTKVANGGSGSEPTVKSAPLAAGPKWSPWLEFGGYYSSERSRTETGLFSPLWQSSTSMLFTDMRGKLFEESVAEGNFALGLRHMLPSGWNLGIWAGYDVRRSTTGNVFHQASLGLEALHPDWDFRLNGYLPLTGAKSGGTLTDVQLSGNQIFMVGGREIPLYGADFETGVKLAGDDRGNEFRLYTGGFWFDGKDALQKIVGPKARAELRLADVLPSMPGSRLTLEAEVRHDEVRKTDWEIGARLRIPFGGGIEQRTRTAALTAQERRMMEAIERDTDIVTAASGREGVTDVVTGVKFDRVAYVSDGGSISAASTAAGANSLIVASDTVGGAQTLQGNQTLQGGSSTIQVRGQTSGAVAGFTAPGAAAILDTPGNATNLSLAGSNTHVTGLTIQGAGAGNPANHGIAVGSGLDNLAISQTSVSDTGGIGIFFASGNSNVTLSGLTITDTAGRGISFDNGNSHVTITGTTVANTENYGIVFEENNNNVTISATTVSNTSIGIGFMTGNSNVLFSGVTVTDTDARGISFDNGNSNVLFSGVTVTDAGVRGISFANGNSGVTIVETNVSNVLNGIIFGNDNSDVTIFDTTVSNTSTGIGFVMNNDNVAISRTTIENSENGIALASDNNNVTLDNSILAGTFISNGIYIFGTGNTLNGTGNTAVGAAFGGNLCQDFGSVWTGSTVFDGTTITAANCP